MWIIRKNWLNLLKIWENQRFKAEIKGIKYWVRLLELGFTPSVHQTCKSKVLMLTGTMIHIQVNIHIYVYIGLSRLLELRKPEYDWGVGWGGMLTFMWACGSSWCYAHAVNLRQQLMLRTRGVEGVGWGGMLTFMWTCGSSWCYAHAGWGGWGGVGC